MIPGEVLEVLVQKLVARSDHQGRPELHGAPSYVALPVPFQCGASAGDDLPRPHQRAHGEGVRTHQACSLSIFIEKHFEGNRLVLDEGFGVATTASPDSRHVGAGVENLLISLADLTGPFPAGESTEVTQEENHPRILLPPIPQSVLDPLRIDQPLISEGRDIKRHQEILEPHEGWPNSET